MHLSDSPRGTIVMSKPRRRTTLAAPIGGAWCAACLFFLVPQILPAAAHAAPDIAIATKGLEKRDGFLPLYWDPGKPRLLVEIPRPGEEFLYLTSVATGLGDVQVFELDRGSTGTEAIGRFERVGGKLHLVIRNTRFRSLADDASLARSVEESFATSTLGAFEIVAEKDGRVVADLTPLFLSDAINVRGALRDARQGSYQLDRDRSRIHLERTKAFPENTEVEAALTFTSDEPGARLRQHVPDARAVTMRQHHSFVRLPGPGYRPRAFDPRIGFFPTVFYDYSQPFDRDPVTRYIVRHRLVKKDPNATLSEPVEPLVYYLDPATPEPYRTAFREGALWWNRVFEAAGFRNALRVEDMPPDMDPMDARYHVITWFHRSEPGASVGPSFVDPRTGEIIKAAVRMDSHRSRVDYDVYAGMFPAMGMDTGLQEKLTEELAMARRRQHTAHEVGHTLGLAHNFAAAFDGRASVMAYPAPLVRLTDGKVDVSEAYRNGPGAWDSLMVRYGYSEFPPGAQHEESGLQVILEDLGRSKLRYVTNPDEGPDGSYPEGTPWVNGEDAVTELARVMRVRRVLLDRFDGRAIRPGEPMTLLGRRFAKVYLHHSYTLGAAIKAIGGMEFDYAVRGDAVPTRVVAPDRQRRALELALDCLEPEELAVPARVVPWLAPTPPGYESDHEAFQSASGPAFDSHECARTLADEILGGIFSTSRAVRVAEFAARDPKLPSLEDVVGRVVERTWAAAADSNAATLKRIVERSTMEALMILARDPQSTPRVRAAAEWGLASIQRRLEAAGAARVNRSEAAHRVLALRDIRRFLERREDPTPRPAPPQSPHRPWPGLDCAWGD